MLVGGNHYEWPSDAHYMEDTMEEYEDWLWEQVLEDGPPQSDDTRWLKHKAWGIGLSEGRDKMSRDAGEALIQAS